MFPVGFCVLKHQIHAVERLKMGIPGPDGLAAVLAGQFAKGSGPGDLAVGIVHDVEADSCNGEFGVQRKLREIHAGRCRPRW